MAELCGSTTIHFRQQVQREARGENHTRMHARLCVEIYNVEKAAFRDVLQGTGCMHHYVKIDIEGPETSILTDITIKWQICRVLAVEISRKRIVK